MTPNLIKNAFFASTLLLLAACAQQPHTAMQPVDLAQTRAPETVTWSQDLTPAPVKPMPEPENPVTVPVPALVNQMSSGDVEVFSLDDPNPPTTVSTRAIHAKVSDAMAAPLPPAPLPSAGVPSSRDSNVTVYPLGQAEGEAPPLEATPDMMPVTPVDQGAPPPSLNNMPGEMTPPPPADDMHDLPPVSSRAGYHILGDAPTRVYFADNSAHLNKNDKQIVRAAGYRGSPVVSVEGHASSRAATADPVQGRIVNLKISMQRAIAVSRQLVASGVAPTAIKLTAFGDTHPSLPIDGKSAEAASRRVEIYAAANE